ncbi:hypothetical protein Taro_015936 [Colocasia esculenta]|uniref:Uncharacterized protein n=1 Tax=Colocasia esculenta TaxID=4460 RepID=A0A843UM77_COLES|nr:hypothetical protein [Colocasia esculenta]
MVLNHPWLEVSDHPAPFSAGSSLRVPDLYNASCMTLVLDTQGHVYEAASSQRLCNHSRSDTFH